MTKRRSMSSGFRRPFNPGRPPRRVPMDGTWRAWLCRQGVLLPENTTSRRVSRFQGLSVRCNVTKRAASRGTFLMAFDDGTARGSVDAKGPRMRRWILTATDVRRRDGALPSRLTEERFETRDRRAKPRLPRVNRLAR